MFSTPIQKKLMTLRAWTIFLVTLSFILFQFALQLTSGIIVSGIMRSYQLNAFQASLLASTYYYTYISLQAPAGYLIDRFGTQVPLTLGALICGLGCYLFGSDLSLAWVLLGRILMGFGAAFAFVGAATIASQWFKPQKFVLLIGIIESSGMLGTLAGAYVIGAQVQMHGWQQAMRLAAEISVTLACIILLAVRDKSRTINPTPKASSPTIKKLFRSPPLWLNGLYAGALFSVITVFGALWAVPFLSTTHHWSLQQATHCVSLLFLGATLGAPILGRLAHKIKQRTCLLMLFSFFTTALMLIIIFCPSLSQAALNITFFFLGLSTSAYVINFSIAKELACTSTRGIAIGFTNMMAMVPAPFLQPAIGFLLYCLSKQGHRVSFEHYTTRHFQEALLIIPILLLSSIFLSMYLPKKTI
jgi:MFS family permease